MTDAQSFNAVNEERREHVVHPAVVHCTHELRRRIVCCRQSSGGPAATTITKQQSVSGRAEQ